MNDAVDTPQRERGGGDHDVPYRFGKHPTHYLHVREFARLLILRSRLGDQRPLRDRWGE